MQIDIDVAAIIVMESYGILSFLTAFVFFRQLRKIMSLYQAFLEALNNKRLSEGGDGKCYSYKWIMDNIAYKRRKLLNATPFLMAVIILLIALSIMFIAVQLVASLVSLGYAIIVAFLGFAVLIETDVFQAYSYAQALYKIDIGEMDREDKSFIEIARETLEKATLRFAALGAAFALVGPFIQQIFNGVVSVLVLYSNVYFQASEISVRVFQGAGFIIIMILSGITLFIPEVLGRFVFRKGKALAHIMRQRIKRWQTRYSVEA